MSLARYFPYFIFKSISLPSTNLGSPANSQHAKSSQSLTCSGCPFKTSCGHVELAWWRQPPSHWDKDSLVTCPARPCTGNCCCRWTAGLLHGHDWVNFDMQGEDTTSKMCQVLPKCDTYIQNVSCTAHVESSACHPAGQGPSTAESLCPHPQAGQSGTADWALDNRKPPESCANPSHCYQTQNCLG